MRFGLVLSTFISSWTRQSICERSLTSLSKTVLPDNMLTPILELVYRGDARPYKDVAGPLSEKFVLWWLQDVPEVSGQVNQFVTRGGDELIRLGKKTDHEVTHLVFLYDDFVYNPNWLIELCDLIARHPDARAWSVYRSSFTRHHRIVGQNNYGDVLMTMHDGLGCMTVEEWQAYRETMSGDFTCPPSMGGGNTIDIHHAYKRPGDRWATGKDYWENIGVHPELGRQDMAIEFVGEGILI